MPKAWANLPPQKPQAILEAKNGNAIAQITYNADFIRDLKEHIPHRAREWDERYRRWIIDEDYEGALEDLLFWHDYSIEDLRKRPIVWYSISWCLGGGGSAGITMYEAALYTEALQLKKTIDDRNCGGRCTKAHTVEKRNRLKSGYHYKRWNSFRRCYDSIIG